MRRNGKQKRAIIYVRQSTKKEESISPEVQAEHAQTHARRAGYEVVDVVVDLHLSGRSFKKRGIAPIIERVGRSEADVVVVWKWSRWGRNLVESLLCLAELKQAGGVLESATEPIDASTAAGKFSVTQMLAIAEFESDRIGDSWKDAKRTMVLKRGLPPVGGARLGYLYETGAKVYRVHPVAGPALRECYTRFIAGASFHSLVLFLQGLGVETTRGNPVTEYALKWSMDSGFAAGLIRLQEPEKLLSEEELDFRDAAAGEDLFLPGVHQHQGALVPSWEPLINADTFRAYRAARAQRGAVPARARNPRQALAGLVRCAGCGRVMTFRPDRDRWVCTNAKTKGGPLCPIRVTIDGDEARDFVKDWLRRNRDGAGTVGEALVRRQLEAASASADVEALVREVARHEKRASTLLDLVADGELSREDVGSKLREIRAEAERARTSLGEARRRAAVTQLPQVESFGALLEGFDLMDAAVMNRGLTQVVHSVWVYPFRDSPRAIVRGTWEAQEPVPVAQPPALDHADGRVCLRCREWKPAEDFYRRSRGAALMAQCIPCRAVIAAEQREQRAREQAVS